MSNFEGKRCIVTGAGRGIGRAIAIALSRAGTHVIAISRTEENLQSLKNEDPKIETIVCDVENLDLLRNAVVPKLPVHFLVNNVGTNILEDFVDVTPEAFEKIFNINFKSVFFISQWVAKSMIDNQIKGSIVHISSVASLVSIPCHSVYSWTKAALDNLAKSMAFELGPHGIRTNTVNPTVVLTELGKRDWSDPVKKEPMLKRTPLRKFAEVEDVVSAVMFLLSDASQMINGVTLPVDGGCSSC